MKPYTVQVFSETTGRWLDVAPTSKDDNEYRFETEDEAERFLRTFYPDGARFGYARVGKPK